MPLQFYYGGERPTLIQKPESLTEKNTADGSTLTTPNRRTLKCDPNLSSKKRSDFYMPENPIF